MATLFRSLTICFVYVYLTSMLGMDAEDTLWPYQFLRNGQTLTSPNQRFELGFFNVSHKKHPCGDLWYLGIWYREIKPLTVVWVANRVDPLHDGGGLKLVLNSVGDLLLHRDAKNMTWINRVNQPATSPALVLLDSGNLVIKDGKNVSDKRYIWQSFNFPSDTLLPGMKLGRDLKDGTERVLTSWRTSKDPSYGEFVFKIGSIQSPQLLLEKNVITQSRWGPWDGHGFSGIYAMKDNHVFMPVYHSSLEEVYFTFKMLDDSMLLRLVVNRIGTIQFLKWKNSSRVWVPMVTLNKDICDSYGSCGPYGICYANDPGCRCLEGFMANSPDDSRRLDRTAGCRRENALNCSGGDGFVKHKGLKLPDNFTVWQGLSPQQCGDYCLKECSCMAYTNIDIYGNGSKCVVWLDKLLDIRDSPHGGNSLYIRMARGDLDSISSSKRNRNFTIICIIFLSAFLWMILWCTHQLRSLSKWANKREAELVNRQTPRVQNDNQDVPSFDIRTVSAATNNFSVANKIGEGGFGPVYQGELANGQRIAVKRLSENSNQGAQEFKNEVAMTAQLQHRNLIKLLGCCTEGEERMLIYEYLPNNSLDHFIFDQVRKRLLPWEKRFNILKGIAKGLDYLHFGSRTRIIHRDLKGSNILLDDEMNPKIADFGLARSLETDREEEITRRVIGTHGYMSPEYMLDGHYSIKSDVFSFGVLALEIISGQKNWGFQHPDHESNLLGHAWMLWIEGKDLELMDPILEESFLENEVKRCIQVGLLCVQHSAEKRPTMSQVVSMLLNEDVRLLEPQEPGFFSQISNGIFGSSSMGFGLKLHTDNGLTITELTGRS